MYTKRPVQLNGEHQTDSDVNKCLERKREWGRGGREEKGKGRERERMTFSQERSRRGKSGGYLKPAGLSEETRRQALRTKAGQKRTEEQQRQTGKTHTFACVEGSSRERLNLSFCLVLITWILRTSSCWCSCPCVTLYSWFDMAQPDGHEHCPKVLDDMNGIPKSSTSPSDLSPHSRLWCSRRRTLVLILNQTVCSYLNVARDILTDTLTEKWKNNPNFHSLPLFNPLDTISCPAFSRHFMTFVIFQFS